MVIVVIIYRKKLKKGGNPNDDALTMNIRNSFLNIFLHIFKKYHESVDETKIDDPNIDHYFSKEKFLNSQNKEYRDFVAQFMETQIFQRFVYKQVNPQTNDDIYQTKYFDEKIITQSRSIFKVFLLIKNSQLLL